MSYNNMYGADLAKYAEGMNAQQLASFVRNNNIDPGLLNYVSERADQGDTRWQDAVQSLGYQSPSQRATDYNQDHGYMSGDRGMRDEFDYGGGYNMTAEQAQKKANKKSHFIKAGFQKLGDIAPDLIKATAIGSLGYGVGGAAGLWDLPGAVGAADVAGYGGIADSVGAGTMGADAASLAAAEAAAGIPTAAQVGGVSGAMGMGSDAASLAAAESAAGLGTSTGLGLADLVSMGKLGLDVLGPTAQTMNQPQSLSQLGGGQAYNQPTRQPLQMNPNIMDIRVPNYFGGQ